MKCDVVLEGGGVRGIALVGALEVLTEQGYVINRVGGTSAGGMVGALVAAGLPLTDIKALVGTTPYTSFMDKGWEDRVGGTALSLLLDQGVYEGNALREWIAGVLADNGVRTFADLRLPDPRSALPPEHQHRLVVTASDLSRQRLLYLPWSYTLLGYDPDEVVVADAIRATTSIPMFFEPVHLRPGPTATPGIPDTVLVDGGLLSNFPIEIFDQPVGTTPRWPTFGIKLSQQPHNDPISIRGPIQYVRALVDTALSGRDNTTAVEPSVAARTIFIDASNVASTDFDISPAHIEQLYQAGRSAAQAFLQTWDWPSYVATYRTGNRATVSDSQPRQVPRQGSGRDETTRSR